MDKYKVMLKAKAYDDIDSIYEYIAESLQNREVALSMVDQFEEAIFSLEIMPYRGAERKIGMFTNNGYRQLFIGDFTIIYNVNSRLRQVTVVRILYSGRDV